MSSCRIIHIGIDELLGGRQSLEAGILEATCGDFKYLKARGRGVRINCMAWAYMQLTIFKANMGHMSPYST